MADQSEQVALQEKVRELTQQVEAGIGLVKVDYLHPDDKNVYTLTIKKLSEVEGEAPERILLDLQRNGGGGATAKVVDIAEFFNAVVCSLALDI